ncbi:MAG: phosphoribosyl-ATP diphosphatase [Alphaproteobacteria bacterium]
MSEHTLDKVYELIVDRVSAFEAGKPDSNSRTHKLLKAGRAKIAQKLGEEAVEVVIEAVNGGKRELVEESADMLFFLLLLWAERGVKPKKVWLELSERLGLPEHEERARRRQNDSLR